MIFLNRFHKDSQDVTVHTLEHYSSADTKLTACAHFLARGMPQILQQKADLPQGERARPLASRRLLVSARPPAQGGHRDGRAHQEPATGTPPMQRGRSSGILWRCQTLATTQPGVLKGLQSELLLRHNGLDDN